MVLDISIFQEELEIQVFGDFLKLLNINIIKCFKTLPDIKENMKVDHP